MDTRRGLALTALLLAGAASGCGKSASHEAFVAEKCDESRTRLEQLSVAWEREAPELLKEYETRTEQLCADLAASRTEEEARTVYREANPDAWAAELLGWTASGGDQRRTRARSSPMPRLGESGGG